MDRNAEAVSDARAMAEALLDAAQSAPKRRSAKAPAARRK
jgi:hypothetical protein